MLDRGAELAAIATVEVAGWSAPQLVDALRARRINTSAVLQEYAVIDMDAKNATSALRVSPHYYNTDAELDALFDALHSLVGTARAGTGCGS